MPDFLSRSAARHPDATALTDGRRSWSYRELVRLADALAVEIRREADGSRVAGATVAAVLQPGTEAVVALHGIVRSGARLAPLNPGEGAAGMARALRVLQPAVVLANDALQGVAGDAVRQAGIVAPVLAVGPRDLHPGDASGGSVGEPPAPSEPFAVLWTSGTSGSPRGVLLTEAAFRHNARASRERLDLGPDDRWYASLSPAHVGGLALIIRAALLGSGLVAGGAFDAADLSRWIDEGAVTHASLVPTMLLRLLEAREDRPLPTSFRCALVGGAHCPRPLLERALAAKVPVALTYGMTEASSQVATAPPALVRRKPGTVGAALDGLEVRIADDGEILVRGATLAAGVLEAGSARPAAVTDRDGWYHTGDLGRIDQEEHLFVTGRRALRIITGGVNVDPTEVEDVLQRHPAVSEACVLGLPDPEWGERVVAAVVLGPDVPTDAEVLRGASSDVLPEAPPEVRPKTRPKTPAEALRLWARERLPGAKAPKEVLVVERLPRNPNGKVDRGALQRRLSGRRSDPE